ncbi:TauD/TfdA family dioxygenase [Streptomyces kunmingensis]|uniref:TauD/TfdA family dioxygenase n=1 Tax=Streptomyces kunmingensis TaxID=68225 RepID=A0ABU6CL48_9ACTN|nr:TauD/TfdA family dioxygenase [Streptomyces kunmingensis]MEB3965085.1 TauD/TfdA family dioxygenase [Streptomyces kunmingensis]
MSATQLEHLWPPTEPTSPSRALKFRYTGDGTDLPDFIASLVGIPLVTVRDVVIGMRGDDTELVAQLGDFWFHTDATFVPAPPRWMAILVQEADEGGALDLLPTEFLDPARLSALVGYQAQDGTLTAPALEPVPGVARPGRVRYRQDRMTDAGNPMALADVHEAVREAAEQGTVPAGELGPGDCLLLDNWTVLHRRTAFEGRRVIRRLWLDPAPGHGGGA